jgi:hypothetical protein
MTDRDRTAAVAGLLAVAAVAAGAVAAGLVVFLLVSAWVAAPGGARAASAPDRPR